MSSGRSVVFAEPIYRAGVAQAVKGFTAGASKAAE